MPSGHRPPIPPGNARVAISGTYQGHRWTQVFYLQLTGSGIVAADCNTLASDIAADWGTWLKGLALPSVVLSSVQVVYIPSVGNEINGAWSGSTAGTGSGTDVENASTCAVINWKISAYYRGGHPRSYFPGLAQASITNGSTLTGSWPTSAATDFAGWLAAINARTTTNITGVVMGTLSFQTGNSWRGTPVFRPFTGVAIRSTIGSQRRRLKS